MTDELTKDLPNLVELGKQIKAKRKAEGLNQKTLAALAGCSHVPVVHLERGTGKLNLNTAWKIMDALGMTKASSD